jgi:hypothetical protein
MDCVDDKGRLVTMPYRRAMRMAQRRAARADQSLGIHRKHIPFQYLDLPQHPNTSKFIRLAAEIERIAHVATAIEDKARNIPITFETLDASVWMRCVQLYWNAKGLALAYRVYPLPMPDPLAEGEFIQQHLLPSAALRNLRLDVNADESWYRLVVAGEPYIQQWSEERGYEYPFTDAENLFLETLRVGFEIYLTEGILCPAPAEWSRKQHRDHYRRWLKFLGDHFSGESVEAEFEDVLMTMSWKGYALSALRPLKSQQPFSRLWKAYLKTHRPLIDFQETAIYWDDERPYQSDTAPSGRRTRQQMGIQSEVTQDGHFIWHRNEES